MGDAGCVDIFSISRWARDLRATIEYMMNAENRSLKRGSFNMIGSIEAPDASTVTFHLKEPHGGVKKPLRELEMRDELGGDGVVAFQGFVDVVDGDGAFAANAPEIAAKLDDGGGQGVHAFSGIENERDAIAELAEDFIATFTSGRTGNIGAGAGERNAEFGDEVVDDFVPGPAESDTAGVARNFQGKAVGRVDHDRKRTGPAGLSETEEIIGKIFGEDLGINERIDEDGESTMLGASFDAENFFDGSEIYGISSESVEGVRRHSDHGTTI